MITLHSKNLSIETVVIDGHEGRFSMGENDELTLSSDHLVAGEHTIVIGFSGKITDEMHGLYPCYFEHDGVKKELLATQFESHHAREVFPCVDEPAAKATFDVTLTTETDITVLGNMPIRTQSVENDQLVTSFNTTPRMSTYLLAWVTGELQRKTAHTKGDVEVNVWATPAQPAASLDFALDTAVKAIEFYNDYFGTDYPLPKSDHVALPDFSSGAMENWGLITYREVALLADPATTSISSRRYIATVIAHELAHQWFGNLVTMKWWNDLWLNESFATLMEYLAIDALYPEWNIWLDFSTSESIMALRRDAIDGVQAVQVDVNHPDEISTLFDGAIVYAKGGRLLRMLQYFVGNDTFQAGLRSYFAAHAYDNTEAADLWRAIGHASNKDIEYIMSTWISQSGYPVVSVNQTGNQLTLSQEQFFVGPHQPSTKLWPIPLGASRPDVPLMLTEASITIPSSNETPLRLNNADAAHFITRYSPELLSRLVEEIKTGQLDTVSRMQLLHEQTMIARGEGGNSSTLIPLLSAYTHETADPVWDMISVAIGELKKFVEGSDEEQYLRDLSGNLARELYTKLGWEPVEGESEESSRLRATIISAMLYSEDPEVITEALRRYEQTPLNDLDPELRALILGAAVRHGHSSSIIDTLLDLHKKSTSAELQQDIVSALTSTKQPEVLARLLNLIKDETVVRRQDIFRWYVGIIRNRDGREPAWQWIRNNWDWVVTTFKGDKSYDDFPRYSALGLVTRQQLDEYKAFFAPMQNEPALSRVITMGIGEIEGRVELIERDSETVRATLRSLA
jgi:aminopeptidase N